MNNLCFFIKNQIKYLSLFFSTIIFAIMILDTLNPDLLRPKKITDYSTKSNIESEIEYFKKIGKTQKQIKISIFSDCITNVIKISPVILSILYRNPTAYVVYAGTYFIESAIGGTLRVIVKESRPDDVNNKTSFPSGHTIFVFGAMFMSLILMKRKKIKYIVFATYLMSSVCVAFCRILANRHYPIDVFCGALIGTISFFISNCSYVFIHKKLKCFFD